jgi:hypothetical protein
MIVNQIDWRRLHRHEPPEQRAWPMAIRTLRDFLLRLPEELDGVILSKTDDPVTDLLRVIGTQPEDRKATAAGVTKLLADGYLVHEDGALRIRNFRKGQTGITDDAPKAESRPEQPAVDLSEVRRAAGRKGGLVAQANKQTGSSKTEQTGLFASSKTEQTDEQTEQLASSKTEQSASARDPEDQRREEERDQESPTNSTTLQVIGRAGDQAKVQANDQAKPRDVDLKATAELWKRSRQTVEIQLGDCTTWPEVKTVVAAFKETWGRSDEPQHGGDPRAQAIMARFAEGYTPERLADAVRRSRFADYMTDKQSNQRLVVILKDAERVDGFCSLTALPRKAGEREAKQPEGGDWTPNVRRTP